MGVQQRDVLRALLVETVLLGVAGGAVGVALSAGATLALYRVTPLPLSVVLVPSNGLYLLLAFGFGVVVSLVSGLSPAWRAANEQPVDALRG